jgi:hypothetical protein
MHALSLVCGGGKELVESLRDDTFACIATRNAIANAEYTTFLMLVGATTGRE